MMLDIALHAQDGPVRIKDVAERQGLSVKYLEKLIRVLKDAGFIASKRGPKGGHTLAVPPERISVGAVVRRLEGDGKLVECNTSDASCANEPLCLARRVWHEAAKAMFERLDTISFADLVEEIRSYDIGQTVIPDFLSTLQAPPSGPKREPRANTAQEMAGAFRHP